MLDSPMMRQYKDVKARHKNALVFFRMGDFYELFYDDAETASRELEIVLTKKFCGGKNEAPMCGVPYHSAESYISRLINKGYKVAICEQVSEPKKGKELVDREVVRIITPGTVVEDTILDREKNNFLCCVYSCGDVISAAWADISTGELGYCLCESFLKLNELLGRLEPSEILCNIEMQVKSINLSTVKYGAVCPFTIFDETAFEYQNAIKAISEQLGDDYLKTLKSSRLNGASINASVASANGINGVLKGSENCVPAVGALLSYINFTQKRRLAHLNPSHADGAKSLSMDYSARRNLELFQNIVDGKKKGSLLWVLDKTKTAMGARTLRSWLESPLLDVNQINQRLDGVGELIRNAQFAARRLAEIFGSEIKDIERICGRLSCGGISPKECFALGSSLKKIPEIKVVLRGLNSTIFADLCTEISDHTELSSLIIAAVKSDAPFLARDGGMINDGYDARLDSFLVLKKDSERIERETERVERDATGIKNLKISHNRIIGYYIEVPKSSLNLVPYRYERKGSTMNSERYITADLKQLEYEIQNANEHAVRRENEIFDGILARIKQELAAIVKTAKALASLDCLIAFTEISGQNGYTRPTVGEFDHIKIIEGRHPVVEQLIKDAFVPNDTVLDVADNKIMIITGPNMAGKSVYMRQVALIAIMAQVGCFVPAENAEICITDKIFTRIGASDDMKTGRSTFMVEMNEVSSILQSAGDRSLIILDEVGRGTSTYDGLSIAWAILETLANKFGAKVLFSTHYHELTELEGALNGVKNYKLTVRESGDSIVFVRKLMRGSANRSFGIEVANLAGLPPEVILRAKELLKKLNSVDIAKQTRLAPKEQSAQLSIFANPVQSEIYKILSELDVNSISPRHALDILNDLKEKAEKA